ncbi:MAG TPA: cytochrome c biogenesis protein CcsA [Myxococcales bacterium]|nr:cytochrome c biogenesis protein CcsA [Myxococcales bacterium]
MIATVLVHIALVAYAAAAAAYLGWLVKPRDRLVSAGRLLLFAGLVLHLASFAAAVSVSHGEGLARAGFGSDAWKGGQLFSILAAATVAGYLALDLRYRLPVAGAFVAPVTVAVMVPAHLVHGGTRAIAPELTHSTALALHVFSAAAGTAALALAFALSLLYLASERQLKSKHPGRLFARLPSLELIDRVGWHLSVWGFVFLSVAIATGSLVSREASGSAFPLAPKQGFAVLAWALLAGLIQARLVAGWRGRRLAFLVVAGFLLLVATYAGLLAAPQHITAAAAALLTPGRG